MIGITLAIILSPQIISIENQNTALMAPVAVNIQQSQISIDEAVRLALANNPRIKALKYDLEAADRGVASASALANPSVTFTPGVTRAGSDEELLISQPLEINGTRSARSGIARAQAQAVKAQVLAELRETVYEVKESYLELTRAQERLAVTKALVEYMSELDSVTQRQVELGSRPGVDATQVRIEASRTKQLAILAEAEYQSSLTSFNTLLGRPMLEPAEVSDMVFPGVLSTDDASLVSKALLARSELMLSRARQEEWKQEARLTQAEMLPDLVPHYRMESFTRDPREGGFGIGINIPILDYGRNRNRIRQAKAAQQAEILRFAAIEAQVRQEVTQALARFRASESVAQIYEEGMLEDSRKLLESTRNGYRLGETTLLNVLEAQRTYRSVQTEYIEALISNAIALAQLEKATGQVPIEWLDEVKTK